MNYRYFWWKVCRPQNRRMYTTQQNKILWNGVGREKQSRGHTDKLTAMCCGTHLLTILIISKPIPYKNHHYHHTGCKKTLKTWIVYLDTRVILSYFNIQSVFLTSVMLFAFLSWASVPQCNEIHLLTKDWPQSCDYPEINFSVILDEHKELISFWKCIVLCPRGSFLCRNCIDIYLLDNYPPTHMRYPEINYSVTPDEPKELISISPAVKKVMHLLVDMEAHYQSCCSHQVLSRPRT